jgi:predicted RNase H-like nuclease (RuvC/YqgF family)
VALVIFAVQRKNAADESAAQAAVAQQIAAQAQQDAKDAAERVASLDREFRDLDSRLGAAQNAFNAAKTEADRAAAQAKLDELHRQKVEMQQRIEAAKLAADKAERKKGFHVRQECLDNALAKGC